MSQAQCESCSMTIESGTYCQYCADDRGKLHPFDEVLTRFMQWTKSREPSLSDAEAQRKTIAFMATMPAWRDHERVRASQ